MIERNNAVRQIIEQGFKALIEQRQPVLHALVTPAVGDAFIKRVIEIDAAKEAGIGGAKTAYLLVIEQHFIGGIKCELFDCSGGTLRLRVKCAEAFQRVAKEIKPHRRLGSGWENVDDAAPHGKVTGVNHRAGAGIAIGREEGEQLVTIHRPCPR